MIPSSWVGFAQITDAAAALNEALGRQAIEQPGQT
jgi:hypothetical protein